MTKANPVEWAIDWVANEASARWGKRHAFADQAQGRVLVADQGEETAEGEQHG